MAEGETRKRWRAQRKEQGTCLRCQNKARPGKTLCEEHAVQERTRGADRYHAMVSENVCWICGLDLPEDYGLRAHRECQDYRNQQRRERRASKR